ncbi:hypothetical protein SARC_14368 [Sphaeroforma arctica JP610]|uniref:Uncharacterized protein n=1 Tax=Sphaeroforma arctica JP610 TaxID=667725 RepID=A0A0L0F8P0_9EUKA|nr:hypothetical protein SARC_14368 [Sphaeroforma arctica JP610]KNC73072.1 hypothetical protein SARC_14368 [Sphaeroforma arctica JP610]|eukprot:XP_014146974.1 hypothetical protein SARC_14368 [Sphaeroforma arctica JP610]
MSADVDCSGYAAPLQRLNEYYAMLKRLSEVSLGKIERDAYVGAARDMRLALVDIHSERRREINRMQLVYINWLFGLSGQSGHKKETIVSHKRWFLGYGDVTEVDQKTPSGADMDKKSHRGTRTFLFNDMIVMCRKKERIFTNLSKEKRYRVEKTLRLKGDFRVTDISGRGTACTSIQLSGIHAAEGLIMGAGTGTDASGTIAVKGRREGRR